jgi:hypothetical protein
MENTLSEKYEANRASIFWGVEHASKWLLFVYRLNEKAESIMRS